MPKSSPAAPLPILNTRPKPQSLSVFVSKAGSANFPLSDWGFTESSRSMRNFPGVSLLLGGLLVGSSLLVQAEPLSRSVLSRMDAEINEAITAGKLPGCVIWVEHTNSIYHKAFGDRSVEPAF